MNLVDSSGWLEYFTNGPKADVFADALRDIDNVLVPSICIYEVFKVALRERGEDEALRAAALMQQGNVVGVTEEVAIVAARTSIELGLPMADSMILAAARTHGATVLTLDAHFERAEGAKYISKR